jgi:hypothetical protein
MYQDARAGESLSSLMWNHSSTVGSTDLRPEVGMYFRSPSTPHPYCD